MSSLLLHHKEEWLPTGQGGGRRAFSGGAEFTPPSRWLEQRLQSATRTIRKDDYGFTTVLPHHAPFPGGLSVIYFSHAGVT